MRIAEERGHGGLDILGLLRVDHVQVLVQLGQVAQRDVADRA